MGNAAFDNTNYTNFIQFSIEQHELKNVLSWNNHFNRLFVLEFWCKFWNLYFILIGSSSKL